MKNVCILGSTGSIGRSTLEVISRFPDRFRAAILTANTDVDTLAEQTARFRPDAVGIIDGAAAETFRSRDGRTAPAVEIHAGEEALCELASRDDIDIVVGCLVGFAGVRPVIEAVKRGKTVALANKETLVAAGELITALAKKHKATIIPVDSEHSAIFQCLAGEDLASVRKLHLTASGGPFLDRSAAEFDSVTVEEALAHPTWNMGKKISIDSATMMNKGLEVIEARWLFGLTPDNIDVLVHPQSIVHSMVEFTDGSYKAQLGAPDMKIPIQYALTWPDRLQADWPRVNFTDLQLSFRKPDREKFRCLALAADALRSGGSAPVVLNASNEVAVEKFLKEEIRFSAIPGVIERALERFAGGEAGTLEEIVETDSAVRAYLREPVFTHIPQQAIRTA